MGVPEKSSMVMEKPSINGCKLGVPPLQETAILPKYYQYKMTSVGQEIEVWETMGSRWVDSTLGMITRIIATSNNHKTLPSMDRNLSWLAAEKIQQVIFYPCISYIHYFPCMANYFQIVVKPPSWAPENSSAGSVGNPTETSFSSGWNRCHLSRWIQTCLVPIFDVGTVWVPIISTNFGHGLPDMLARWITSDGLGWISIELTAWSEQLQESHSPALGRWPRPFTAPYGGPLQSRSGRKKSHIFFRKGMVLIEPCLKCWNRCTMSEGWSLIHPHTKSKTGPTEEGLRRFTGHRWFCPLSLTWWATQTLDQINQNHDHRPPACHLYNGGWDSTQSTAVSSRRNYTQPRCSHHWSFSCTIVRSLELDVLKKDLHLTEVTRRSIGHHWSCWSFEPCATAQASRSYQTTTMGEGWS